MRERLRGKLLCRLTIRHFLILPCRNENSSLLFFYKLKKQEIFDIRFEVINKWVGGSECWNFFTLTILSTSPWRWLWVSICSAFIEATKSYLRMKPSSPPVKTHFLKLKMRMVLRNMTAAANKRGDKFTLVLLLPFSLIVLGWWIVCNNIMHQQDRSKNDA